MTATDVEVVGGELVDLPDKTVKTMDALGIRLSDPSDIAWKIAEQLFQAETIDELLDEGGERGWLRHEGEPVSILNVWWLPSDFGESLGFYALVEATVLNTGERVTLSSGSTNVVVQIAGMIKLDQLDTPVRLVKAKKPTSKGFYPTRLVKA